MSFEKYRCMFNSEDNADEEYAVCLYPKCWIMECPHKQARDRLAKAQALPDKWQHDMPVGSGMPTLSMREIYFRCIHELEEALKGAMSNGRSA